jgi:hypothetical protein
MEIVHVAPGATCIDAARLVEQVNLWLEGESVAGDLEVEVRGSDEGPTWVEFTLRRGDELLARRHFEPLPSRCENLEATLSLSIALALKVSLIEQFVPTRSEPSAPPAAPEPTAARHVRSAPAPSEPASWSVATPLRVTLGVAPTVALGAGLTATRASSQRLMLQLGIEGLRDRAQLGPGEGSLSVGVVAARLDGCTALSVGREHRVRSCLGARAGVSIGRGDGFAEKRTVVSRWAAATAALGLTLALHGPWSLDVSAALLVSLTPTRFEVSTPSGVKVAARALPALGGELAIGPQYRF